MKLISERTHKKFSSLLLTKNSGTRLLVLDIEVFVNIAGRRQMCLLLNRNPSQHLNNTAEG